MNWRRYIILKRSILTFGIISLFILSALAPMTFGYNARTSVNIQRVEKGVQPFEDPNNEIWIKTYGGSGIEHGEYVQQTSDNGYILVGSTKSYGAGDWDIWLVKTDIDGNEVWNKTYGGIYEDIGHCVRQTIDGGYIIIGYSIDGNTGPSDVWLIKTDLNGNVTWDNKFRGISDSIYGKSVIEVDDGYLIIAKVYNAGIPLKTDIWLIKTDFDGNEQWNKYIGVGFWDTCNAVIQTSEGDFVIVGNSVSFISEKQEVLLIKTDSNGNRIWRKTFDGEEGKDIKECDDGGYIIVGRFDILLIKTDINGNLLWQRKYQWVSDFGLSVDLTSDGGFIVSGNAGPGFEFDLLILKTDEDGNREWENRIGIVGVSDSGYCVIQSNDDTYVVTGSTYGFGAASSDFWLVKVAPFENQRPNKPIIDGPNSCIPGKTYYYNVSTTEPDGESLFYWFDWGDSYTPWQGPFESGETCSVPKTWYEKGSYNVNVIARDIYGGDGRATLEVSVPRTKATDNMLLLRFLEQFPLLKEVLLRLIPR